MLSQENNEILTRVGPGTPMGNLLRRFWIPALLEQEIVERDGAPVKLRLLGEIWSPSAARREKSESLTPIARIVARPCAWAATKRMACVASIMDESTTSKAIASICQPLATRTR